MMMSWVCDRVALRLVEILHSFWYWGTDGTRALASQDGRYFVALVLSMVDLVLARINLIIEDFFILEIFIFSRLDDAHGPAWRLIRYPAHKAREATLGHRCCPVGHGSIRLRHLLVQLMILAYVDLILSKLREVGVDRLRR
jgi:hypothetical protein